MKYKESGVVWEISSGKEGEGVLQSWEECRSEEKEERWWEERRSGVRWDDEARSEYEWNRYQCVSNINSSNLTCPSPDKFHFVDYTSLQISNIFRVALKRRVFLGPPNAPMFFTQNSVSDKIYSRRFYRVELSTPQKWSWIDLKSFKFVFYKRKKDRWR